MAGWLGWMYFVVGRYAEAAAVNARLPEICARVFGPEHHDTVEARSLRRNHPRRDHQRGGWL